jgi:hypothetical protein
VQLRTHTKRGKSRSGCHVPCNPTTPEHFSLPGINYKSIVRLPSYEQSVVSEGVHGVVTVIVTEDDARQQFHIKRSEQASRSVLSFDVSNV